MCVSLRVYMLLLVKIFHAQHKYMDPSFRVLAVEETIKDVMLLRIHSWHTLVEHQCNAKVYLSIVAGHVHPFMVTVHPFPCYFQENNTSLQKACII